MFSGIPSFSLTHPTLKYTLRWFDPLTAISIPINYQKQPFESQIYMSSMVAFYLLKTKELKQIKWQYEGKISSIELTADSSELPNFQMESQKIVETDSCDSIYGENGILRFTENHQTREGVIPLQNLLNDSAFFASQTLGIEMAITSVPLFDENNQLCSMPILQLSIPSQLAFDAFSELCNQLESPDFFDAIIQHNPQTLFDIGLIAWQLFGNDIQDPQLLCAKELLK